MPDLEQSQFEQARKEQEMRRQLEERHRAELRRMEEEKAAEEVRQIQAGEREEGEEVSQSPRAIMARLRAARIAEIAKAGGEGEEGALAQARRLEAGIKRLQNIYRMVNGASAVTLVGLIITFLVMNAQLIFGNLLKVRFVPPLSLPEIIILLVVDLVVGLAILVVASLVTFLIYIVTHPVEAVKLIGEVLKNTICQAFGGCQGE